MIFLQTDVDKYRNDICEVIRLFTGIEEIHTYSAQQLDSSDMLIECGYDGEAAYAVFTHCGRSKASEPFSTKGLDALTSKKVEKRSIKRAVFCAMRQAFDTALPWGCLTGIRPTKLAREMIDHLGEERALSEFSDTYFVSPDKVELLRHILKVQQPIINSIRDNDFDLYIGIPFCRTRCVYCSFAAVALGNRDAQPCDVEAYVKALLDEIYRDIKQMFELGYRLRSMYIGGGTPTALSVSQLESIIKAALSLCPTFPSELTVEAGRPDTINTDMLKMMKSYGVNRISINPQSMNDETLRAIGRDHTSNDVIRSFDLARSVGFDVINMDLIAGLPGENTSMFVNTLEKIAKLKPDNLTVHTLAIKRASILKMKLGDYPLPDGSEVSKMIDLSREFAHNEDMNPYYMYRQKHMTGQLENVGYCTNRTSSIYNIDIMEEICSILALGAGAISKRVYNKGERIERLPNPKDIPTYKAKSMELSRQRLMMFK